MIKQEINYSGSIKRASLDTNRSGHKVWAWLLNHTGIRLTLERVEFKFEQVSKLTSCPPSLSGFALYRVYRQAPPEC